MTAGQVAGIALALAAAWALTGVVRGYAVRAGMIDVPNDRSSHDRPTPRGGGLAIVLVTLTAVAIAGFAGWVHAPLTGALLIGGGLMAAVGWLDDRRRVAAGPRFAAHLAGSTAAVVLLGGLPELKVGTALVPLGWAGSVLAALSITWAVNFFNFMDGIDGLAGSQAVLVGLAAGGLLLWRGEGGLAFLTWVTAAASAGFLWWNWPPARIFMGDVGSGYLGFLLGTLALASERAAAVPALVWLVLVGLFFVDATATLIRRTLRRERWSVAHRAHAYQQALRLGWDHARVTRGAILVNAVLAALATLAVAAPRWTLAVAIAAGAGLLLLFLWIVWRAERVMEAAPMTPAPRTQNAQEPAP
ncbi:MAG: MraY family glycosyltransferase [Gemmatimonadales bacterium]